MVAPIVSFGSGSGMRLTGNRYYWSRLQAPEKLGIPSFYAFFSFSAWDYRKIPSICIVEFCGCSAFYALLSILYIRKIHTGHISTYCWPKECPSPSLTRLSPNFKWALAQDFTVLDVFDLCVTFCSAEVKFWNWFLRHISTVQDFFFFLALLFLPCLFWGPTRWCHFGT